MIHSFLIYAGLFLGIFLEGELVLLSAVIAAHHGLLNLWLVLVIAVIATLSSDMFYFNLGRKKMSAYLEKSKWSGKLIGLKKKFNEHRIKTLLGYRFLYGFRTITPIFLGTQDITFKSFFKYSIIGTLIWVTVITGLGILFGELIVTYLKDFEKAEYYIIGILLIIVMLSILVRFIKKAKKQ
tara:strand:- start:9203 stop:9748 length:546 start_codon:yes stop_codon:yes gene_type:complete